MLRHICILFCLFSLTESVGNSSTASCGFQNQCVYDIKINHCKLHTKKRNVEIPLTSNDCLCLDLDRVKNQLTALRKWANEMKNALSNLASTFNATRTELDQKQKDLRDVRHNIQQRNMTIQIVDSKKSKLDKQIITENQQWASDKTFLKTQLQNVKMDLNNCNVAKSVTTTPTTTDSSSTTNKQHYMLTFCDFDNNKHCVFNQSHGDTADFKLGKGKLSSSTGPVMDHTYGNPHGNYMYIDSKSLTSSSHKIYTARLVSKLFPPSSGYCIMFWYNMHGKNIRDLKMYAEVEGGLGNAVFHHTGQIDSKWHLGKVSLDSEYTSTPFRVVFEATTDPYKTYHYSGRRRSYYTYYNTDGNIAIDDIYVYNISCSDVPTTPLQGLRYDKTGSTLPTYYQFFNTPSTWYDAKAACKQIAPTSHLISINDAAEQSFIVNHIKTSPSLASVSSLGFYTSGNDENQEGMFVWTDSGSPYTTNYTDWHPGQPNNVGSNQDCLLLQYSTDDWSWGDVKCTDTHPYICEINDQF